MNNGTRCRLAAGPNQDSSLGNREEEVDAEEKLTVVTNRRLGYSYPAETSDCRCPCPSPSYEGHWCEEDRLFPLKKRRAIFTSAGTAADKEQESVKAPTRVTEKSQRTWVKRFDYPENEEEQENNEAKKKLSAGGGGKIQMVNSRCSRNSGRGWRCNRPAVLGHARCEYHLSRANDHNQNQRKEQENNEAKKKLSGGGGNIQVVVNSRCSRNSGRGWRCNRPAVLGHASCEYHLSRANRNRRTRHKNNICLKVVYPCSLYSEEEEDNGKGYDKRSVGKARSISSLLDQTAPILTSTSGQ